MGVNVKLIRDSFEVARPIASQIADRFYVNLFNDFPQVFPLFAKVDMVQQKKALIGSLVAAVDNLDNPEVLGRFLTGLGERHADYGVEEIHYEFVGQSLLKTFGQFFGDQWTDELRNQWSDVYGVIAEVMKAGARGALGKRKAELRIVSQPVRQADGKPISKGFSDSNTSLKVDIEGFSFTLPPDLCSHIRGSVKSAVQALIRAEVQRAFEDEIRDLSKMSAEEIVRMAS